jgi:hypothetical protein
MPRKKVRKQNKLPKQRNQPRFSLFWVVVSLFILVALYFVMFPLKAQCANSDSCISDLSGSYYKSEEQGVFHGQTVYSSHAPEKSLVTANVLGDQTGKNKRIEVDLENQKIYAFEENKVIYEFPISSGKWGKTPTGDFRIWIKLRYTRMSGGNKLLGTYYNLPNVPYTMFFYNNQTPKSLGFGIHGAYWHNNFGHPMSHGCINMRSEDVEKIYNWATPTSTSFTTYATEEDPGTPIRIYGDAPGS